MIHFLKLVTKSNFNIKTLAFLIVVPLIILFSLGSVLPQENSGATIFTVTIPIVFLYGFGTNYLTFKESILKKTIRNKLDESI